MPRSPAGLRPESITSKGHRSPHSEGSCARQDRPKNTDFFIHSFIHKIPRVRISPVLYFGGPQYTTYTTPGYSSKRGDGREAGGRPRTPRLVPALMRHLSDPQGSVQLTLFSCSPQRPPGIWGPSAPPEKGRLKGLADTEAERQVPSTPTSSLFLLQDHSYFLTAALGAPSELLFLEKNHNSSSDETSCCLEAWRWKHKNSPGNLKRSSGGDFSHLILPSLL